MKTLSFAVTTLAICIMLPTQAAGLQVSGQTRVYLNATEPAPSVSSVCPWEVTESDKRAKLWSKMTPRHRDYHWRLMTIEERKQLLKFLSHEDRAEMRHRYASKLKAHPDNDIPIYFKKHLSPDERRLLRQQVKQASQSQDANADKNLKKTPAQIEHELLLRDRVNKMHEVIHSQIIIISIDDNLEGLRNPERKAPPGAEPPPPPPPKPHP